MPSKCAKASTWPSRKASWAWVPKATWNAHPECDRRITNIHNLVHGPGDGRVELAEVDLCLGPGRVGLWDRYLTVNQAELDATEGDVTRHRHLRQRRAVLGDQPLPHPPRGMPLLTRHLPVTQQPRVDHLDPRIH